MIAFELHTPSTTTSAWVVAVSVRVSDDNRHTIHDPARLLDLDAVHGSPRYTDGVRFAVDPEEWARAAIATFNAPDLVPSNIQDSNPWPEPDYEDFTPEFGPVAHGYVARVYAREHLAAR